jgi:GT2 family glycosyltransferase
MSAPRVSVILPVRNAAEALPALLDALDAQTVDGGHEVIVIDDASRDDTADVARQHGVVVLQTERWSGAYEARNLGLGIARGEIIAFIDGDCRPAPDWLARAIQEIDGGLDLVAGHVDVRLSERPGLVELVDFARYLDQERAVQEGGFGATANLVVRRAAVDAAGGFEPELLSSGDRILCVRAVAAGYRLAYSPKPVVAHDPRTRAYDLARRTFRDGVARAQRRRLVPDSPVASTPLWRHPGAWFPNTFVGRAPLYGVERLHEAGIRPSWWLRRKLGLVEWACVQMPMVFGNLYGEARLARTANVPD